MLTFRYKMSHMQWPLQVISIRARYDANAYVPRTLEAEEPDHKFETSSGCTVRASKQWTRNEKSLSMFMKEKDENPKPGWWSMRCTDLRAIGEEVSHSWGILTHSSSIVLAFRGLRRILRPKPTGLHNKTLSWKTNEHKKLGEDFFYHFIDTVQVSLSLAKMN